MKLPISTGEFFDACHRDLTGARVCYDELPRDENGRPYFPDGSHRKFSISHTEDLIAVTFLDAGETEDVGMDIEARDHADKLTEKVLARILAPNEKPVDGDYLNNFVIKEAYGKLTGKGLGVGFRNYDANDLIKKYRAADLSDDNYVWWILQGLNL